MVSQRNKNKRKYVRFSWGLSMKIEEIPLNKIEPPIFILRKEEEAEIEELMKSLSQVGQLQPIVVRRVGDKYRIICGYRRYLAAKRLGWDKIPARILDNISEVDEKILILTENIQRKDVNAFELARVVIDLIENHKLSLDEVATRLGKSKSYVSKLYSLRKLSPELFQRGLEGKLDYEVAYELSRIEDKGRQMYYAQRIIEERLDRRTAIEWIKTMEAVRPLTEMIHENVRVNEEGEYVEVSQRNEQTEEVTPAEITQVQTGIECLVCGRRLPSNLITTYNPICKECLSHCSLCGRTTQHVYLITVCPECFSILKKYLSGEEEEKNKENKEEVK